MTPEAKEALLGSIAKWEAIVDGTGKDQGPDNCPLCKMFFQESDKELGGDEDCLGCPVRNQSGQRYCRNTPYIDYAYSQPLDDHRAKAQAELDFLKSLLPKQDATLSPN